MRRDNIFGAYQFSLDAKELAYSQLIAVIKTKTSKGMVPNFWQPQSISYDRTEPIIGAKVLHETFRRWNETWIVELLFDDCYDWTQWFFRRRRDAPLGLIVLGSDAIADTTDSPNMQAARYESGLDNSAMYDGDFFSFNETLQSGHMHLYDVGMASMLAMELQALADLAATAFTPPRTEQHAAITAQLTALQGLIQQHLWNEELGIYVNKFSAEYTGRCNASGIVNGTNCSGFACCKDGFYNRISPTSFYPMQAGPRGRAVGGWRDDDAGRACVHTACLAWHVPPHVCAKWHMSPCRLVHSTVGAFVWVCSLALRRTSRLRRWWRSGSHRRISSALHRTATPPATIRGATGVCRQYPPAIRRSLHLGTGGALCGGRWHS